MPCGISVKHHRCISHLCGRGHRMDLIVSDSLCVLVFFGIVVMLGSCVFDLEEPVRQECLEEVFRCNEYVFVFHISISPLIDYCIYGAFAQIKHNTAIFKKIRFYRRKSHNSAILCVKISAFSSALKSDSERFQKRKKNRF